MGAEKTIQKEREGSTVELRKIIGTPKNQEDMDKWKETVATDYLMRKAEETGNEKLKEKLERLSGKSLEDAVSSEKAGQEKNAIDIVMLPISKDEYYIYTEKPKLAEDVYGKEPKLEEKIKNLTVNIHTIGDYDKELVNKSLRIAEKKLYEILNSRNYCYSSIVRRLEKDITNVWIMSPTVSTGIGYFIGFIVGLCSGDPGYYNWTASGITFGSCLGIGLAIPPIYQKAKRKELKKARRMAKITKRNVGKANEYLNNADINWIEDSELTEVYNTTLNKESLKKRYCKNKIIRGAISRFFNSGLEIEPLFEKNYISFVKQPNNQVIKKG